jgi:hypothetical protein
MFFDRLNLGRAIPMNNTAAPSILRETKLAPRELAKLVKEFRPGKETTVQTIMRWIKSGVLSANGIVRLEAVKIGGRWITSLEALERFAAAQTPNQAA